MSLHTTTRIQIEGRKDLAETFQSFELHELIDGHHRFKLELPGRLFGQGEGMGFWRELVGRRIYIEITPANKNLPYASKEFSGLITEVSLGKSHGPQGNIVLKGGSPTLLLDDDPHMHTFAEQTMQQIVDQQLRTYPANLLQPQVDTASTDPLEYKVQYKENTCQLLQRLSAEYGEWLFYNGQQLVFGSYHPVTVSLTHDKNLDQFNLQMGVQSINMRMVGYDYSGDRRTTSDTHSHAPTGINIHSSTALEASQGLFAHPALFKPNESLSGDAARRIDRAAARQSASATAEMVHLEGISHCPSLGMGTHVSVQESLYGKETYGRFMLTEVHHECNSEGEYRNRFRGVPADVAAPPSCLDTHPGTEAQSAVVIDNDDPEDLGRLRDRKSVVEGNGGMPRH